MARGAVSAAKMMISDVPRLSVLVAVEEVSKMACAVEEKGANPRWRLFVVGGSARLLLPSLASRSSTLFALDGDER